MISKPGDAFAGVFMILVGVFLVILLVSAVEVDVVRVAPTRTVYLPFSIQVSY